MSNKQEKPTWKNTLNYELKSYTNIKEVAITASSTGYLYFTWMDGDVYKVVKEYSPKGYFIGVVSEATGTSISDLDG